MDPENIFLSGFRNPDCTVHKVVAVWTGPYRRPFVLLHRCTLSRMYGDKGRMVNGGRTGEYVDHFCSTQLASVLPHVLNDEFSVLKSYEIIIESMFANDCESSTKTALDNPSTEKHQKC